MRLRFSNEIGYMPAYQTIQVVLTKMHSNKAKSFAKFLALAGLFMATDEYSFCNFAYYANTYYF